MVQSTARIARFTSLFLAALSTGVFFGTTTSLGPSTKTFTAKTYVEVQQATIRNLRPVMGPLLPTAVAANMAVVVLSRRERERRSPAFALTLIGLLSQLASLVLTGVYELPSNARVMAWSPENPPEGWETERDRWETVHTVRTATSVVGLGCLVAAALVPPGASRS